jgi:hypothetical protein
MGQTINGTSRSQNRFWDKLCVGKHVHSDGLTGDAPATTTSVQEIKEVSHQKGVYALSGLFKNGILAFPASPGGVSRARGTPMVIPDA